MYAFAALVLLAIGLAISAPYLASTKPVLAYALGQANQRLVGSVELDGLALGWGGPLEARGVKIMDAARREVLTVDRVSCAGGLWGLVTRGLDFGEVIADGAKASLFIDPRNEISLVQAFGLKSPVPPSASSGGIPDVRGKLVLMDGAIRATRENGPSYEVTQVSAKVNVDTLAKITADIGLTLADGVPLRAEADINDLLSAGELRPLSATGKLTLQTGGEVKLGPLTEFLTPGQRIEGAARLKLDASGDAENLKADLTANVSGLQTAARAADKAAPVNLAVTARLERRGQEITADAGVTGDAGTAEAKARYQLSDQPVELDGERILAAIQRGTSLALPEFTLEVTGGIDMARLGQALPNVLHLKQGLQISGGRLEIERLSAQGGAQPTAKGKVRMAEVTGIEDGRPVRAAPISLDFDAALVADKGLQVTFADLKSSFAEVSAQGGASDIKASFRADLARLQAEVGQIIDLGNLNLAGEVSGTVALKRSGEGRDLDADFKADASGLKVAKSAAASATVTVGVAGQIQRRGDDLTAKTQLTGDIGSGDIGLTYTLTDTPPDLDLERLLSAVLSGESLSLPNGTLEANVGIDLARLGQAVPSVLQVKPGTELTGGRLDIAKLSARGGSQPTAQGSVKLTGVTAVDAGRAIRMEPIDLGFDVSLVAGQGLQITRAELASSFAQLTAKGSASEIQATFRTDLSRAQADLGQILDLSGFALGGEVSGSLTLTRKGDDQADFNVSADATALRYASGDHAADVQRATLGQGGHISLRDGKVTRVDVPRFEADFDGQVALSGAGWYDLAGDGFHADLDIKRGELGYAAARLAGLGVDALAGFTGVVSGKAVADRAAANGPISSSGALSAANLARDGAAIVEGDARIEWKELQAAPDLAEFSAQLAELRSTPATVQASGVRLRTGGVLEASADVKASAGLAQAMRTVAALTRMEKPPAIGGQFAFDGRVATTAGTVTFNGKGGVDQLEVGAGEKTVREKRIDFEFDGIVDDPKDRVTLSSFRVKSTPLTAEASGAVEQYKNACVLGIKGRYDASWKELTAILHELVPDTAQTIIVAGQSASAFEITGPMRGPNQAVEMRTLNSGTDVGWASADIFGVGMGGAKLSPTLRDGQLTIPKTTIPAAEGKVNVQAAIDFRPAEPTLNVPGSLSVLDNVAVTPLLSTSLLGRINPIFHHTTKVDGRIHLVTQDVLIPLGDTLTKGGSGSGVLDLRSIKIQPTGFLASLLELGGFAADKPYPVEISKVNLVIKEGRIHYENFSLTFPDDFALIFRGSVGFDSTLDLVISIPVREGLLRRVGVKGDMAGLLKPSSNLRVDVPLAGTRENPKLDFSKVDVASLLKGAVPDTTKKLTDDLLKGILDGGKSKEQPKAQPPPPPKKKRSPGRP